MDNATPRQQIEPSFHPEPVDKPSPEYQEFLEVREEILDVIRTNSRQRESVVSDIVDALIEGDIEIPSGLRSGVYAFFTLGMSVLKRRKRKEMYRRVAGSILERIFDPSLEYRMRKRDILDVFQANGMNRERVSASQIEDIYVIVIEKLEVGELRDLTYEHQIHRYALLKIREIRESRQEWMMNWR